MSSEQPSHEPLLSPGDEVGAEGRYRIHRLLGSGAMGAVYRADDRKLFKIVALKAPHASSVNELDLRERLRKEVWLAQKVSHPNVCRVYDLTIDENRNLALLSMELVEGEPLDEVLRRSDQLPRRKLVRMAGEICAGLEAIHDQGIVHRDLKPGNVMIDSQGRTVITDFGIAEEGRAMPNPRGGAPGYMAPEQVQGGKVTVKSDLYGLGVVLHEMFTGRRPSRDLDPGKLAACLRKKLALGKEQAAGLAQRLAECLDDDPEERPESARAVAEAFPQEPHDPQEGHSSPVYRLLTHPRGGGLSRRAAWACLGATLLGLVLVAVLSQHTQPTQAALAGKPPAELAIHARTILTRLGSDDARTDHKSGFVYAQDPERPVLFWYRQSPGSLSPWRKGSAFQRYEDPPLTTSGEVGVHLDPRGRLVRLDAVPQEGRVGGSNTDAIWSPLLRAAGLDLDRLEPVVPHWDPPVFADRRAAWVTSQQEASAMSLRIEAAALNDRPVGFRHHSSEAARTRTRSRADEAPQSAWPMGTILYCLGFGAMLFGVSWLAWCRLRDHVADRPAAFRLAIFAFAARTLVGVFGAPHRWSPVQLDLALAILSRAVLVGALVWVIYVALEPWVRYYSPRHTASWVRLVYGWLRDPLVGRDLLVGGLFGLGLLLWVRLYALIPALLGLPSPRPDHLSSLVGIVGQSEVDLQTEALSSLPRAVSMTFYALAHGVLLSLVLVGALVLLRRVLVKPRISRPVGFVLLVILLFPTAGHPALDLMAATGAAGLLFAALFRFGFLTTVTAMVFTWVLSSHPLTLDPTSWAFAGAMIPLLLALSISLWGFRAAVGARFSLPVRLLRLRLRTS